MTKGKNISNKKTEACKHLRFMILEDEAIPLNIFLGLLCTRLYNLSVTFKKLCHGIVNNIFCGLGRA